MSLGVAAMYGFPRMFLVDFAVELLCTIDKEKLHSFNCSIWVCAE